ncbi:MAG: DUF1343 domain-containing protein [bacterium]
MIRIFCFSILLLISSSCSSKNSLQIDGEIADKPEIKTAIETKTVVKTGIEVLRDNNFDILKGKKVGLITNPTGIDSKFRSTIDILFHAEDVNLVALFAPEHGVRGNMDAGARVANSTDNITGVPVYSIYGKTNRPTAEMLENIDVLVYDIQDIGCRSYTFISTMGLAMKSAAENGVDFVVLDRPNPLGGEKIEGNVVEDGCYSFVSQFSIPYIYGQTPGELAQMLNEENYLGKKCNLTVVKMEGWQRSMNWEATGLPWVPASPHIPHAETAFYYPATGILGELGYINIGVGYTMPFQTVAAPWINADSLSIALNDMQMVGVYFRPTHYKPMYSAHSGSYCSGVQIYITDFAKVRLTEIQFRIMEALNILYPSRATLANANSGRFAMFDKVCGSKYIRATFTENHRWADIKDFFEKDEAEYKVKSSKYYLYE